MSEILKQEKKHIMNKKILNMAIAMIALAGASAYADNNVVSNVKETTEKVANKVSDGTKNAIEATKDGFKKGAQKVEKTAKKVGDKVGEESKNLKEDAKRGGRKVSEFVKGENKDSVCPKSKSCCKDNSGKTKR